MSRIFILVAILALTIPASETTAFTVTPLCGPCGESTLLSISGGSGVLTLSQDEKSQNFTINGNDGVYG